KPSQYVPLSPAPLTPGEKVEICTSLRWRRSSRSFINKKAARRPPKVTQRESEQTSVGDCATRAQAGLRAHELRDEQRAGLACGSGAIGDREEPDAQEGHRHGEQRRVLVGEDRL